MLRRKSFEDQTNKRASDNETRSAGSNPNTQPAHSKAKANGSPPAEGEGLSFKETLIGLTSIFTAIGIIATVLNLVPDLAHNTLVVAALIVMAFIWGAVTLKVYEYYIAPYQMQRNLRKARQELGLASSSKRDGDRNSH